MRLAVLQAHQYLSRLLTVTLLFNTIQVWKDYYAKVDAIVYLVDAADRERFPESMRELNGLLSDDGLSTVPFLVLGNKVGGGGDVDTAAGLMGL